MKQPTKAIICAAGLGTRFLPQTKSIPKEMLPLINKPVIQVIVEQAVAAGVTDIIIVTGGSKRAIEDYFDRDEALENELREKGKDELADEIKRIAELANFVYVRQKGTPKGNARPLLNVRHLVGDDEPFFVFFPDDIFRSETPWPVQMKDQYNEVGKSVIAFTEVPRDDADKYGIAIPSEQISERLFKLGGLIEKPTVEAAPSTFASVGSYLFTPEIWTYLEREKVGNGGEIGVADSINDLAREGEIYGYFIDGVRHDTGDQLEYIKAVVDMALESDKFGAKLADYLKQRLS